MSDERSSGPAPGSGALFSPLLEAAIRLAARGHYHQFRKTNDEPTGPGPNSTLFPDRVPYIAHLMGTVCILARLGVRDEVLAAAALHDYLEDVPDPDGRESIRAALGDDVLELVEAVTEDKRSGRDLAGTWEVRKLEQVDHVAHMPEEAVLIKAADVLHNMQSLLADLAAANDAELVWEPFNAGPERQLWYFEALTDAVERRLGGHPLTRDLRAAVAEIRSGQGD
jgi:hypothetical protein